MKIPAPLKGTTLDRPDFDGPMRQIIPKIAQNLKDDINNLKVEAPKKSEASTEITVGTVCKHSGCNWAYEGEESNYQDCVYHPGCPIFHEGLKFWSCCTKRTTDFTAFMNQIGCATGKHKWSKDENESEAIKCRYDWHQTATNVVIAIYAKLYHYQKSHVKVNPVRLSVKLVFPQQQDAEFNLELELRGIIDVSKTTVSMLGTKIEISMPKAEAGSWIKLDFPRDSLKSRGQQEITAVESKDENSDSDIDLDCVEAISVTGGGTITELD